MCEIYSGDLPQTTGEKGRVEVMSGAFLLFFFLCSEVREEASTLGRGIIERVLQDTRERELGAERRTKDAKTNCFW